MSDWWSADPVGQPNAPQDDYGKRISSIESGGNYSAVGPQTGKGRALGKYQVMEFNVGAWTREALGREMNPREFLASPEAQEAVFKNKFGGYVSKYGPEGAARAWFAGEKGMNNPNAKDILGTTVADYSRKFVGQGQLDASSANRRPQGDWWSNDPVAEARQPEQEALPEMQGPPRAPIGMMESAVRGANQGVFANFGDEFAGLRSASGLPVDLGGGIPGALQAGVGAARMGIDYLTAGGTGAQDEYTRRVEIEREKNKQAQEQNPGSYMGGTIAGGLVMPGGPALQAATMPARIGRGMAVGAAYGGASGAGEGESATDRASRATFGAGIGGIIGGFAVPVVDAAVGLARTATQPIANTIRGFRDPEGEASRRIVTAIRRDQDAGDLGITAAEYRAGRAAGTPVANVDIGGETTRALARSAANTSPEARGVLTRMSDARFETQGPRTASFIQNLVGLPADAPATRDGLKDLARRVNAPLYKRAYEKGADGIWTPEIERLAGSEAVVGAMQSALKKVSDENVISGYGAMNPRVQFSSDGRLQFSRKPNGMPAYPDLQFWDLTRRELSDAAKNAGYGTSEARRLETIAKALNKELDNAVPEYGMARGTAAKFFDVGDALEAGEAFLTQKSVKEMAPIWGKMSKVEKTLFAEGFTSSLIDKINKVGDRRSILNAIDNSTDARQRLNMALGPQKAEELRAFLRVESVMDKMRGSLGNSTTARQLIESGLAGGATLGYSGDPTTAMSAAGAWMALRYGGRLAGQRIDQNVARRVGEMLASNDPAVLRRGIALVAKNSGLQKALRAIDDQIAKFGGIQTEKGFIPLQSVNPSRAEDDPEVNRPRGQ